MTRDEIAQAMQDTAGNSWGDEAHFQRFAALVIKPWVKQLEVERKKFQELNGVVTVAMQHARADEREACARVAEEGLIGHTIAKAIRARGSA